MKTWIVTTACFVVLAGSHVNVLAPQDLDDITFGKYRILPSKILNQDRTLYVNLPGDYEDSAESYPVVFQLYGHFLENYYLPAVRTTSLMQQSGEAPGVIVVGVMNREFRYRDLLPVDNHGAKSEIDNFLRFFEEELIPFVEKNYRTNGYRILSGPQAGAAFGVYALAKKPDLFGAFFLTNPFWIGAAEEPLLTSLERGLESNDYSHKFLMITCENDIPDDEAQALERLAQMIRSNGSFQYVLNEIEEDSDFTAPVDFKKGMKTLFKDYKFPATDVPQELGFIEAYYRNLSREYGFEVTIPQQALVFEGDKFVKEGSLDKAKLIFLKMQELYPDGLMALDRLGTVAIEQGEYDKALEYYNQFLARQPANPYVLSRIKQIQDAKKQ